MSRYSINDYGEPNIPGLVHEQLFGEITALKTRLAAVESAFGLTQNLAQTAYDLALSGGGGSSLPTLGPLTLTPATFTEDAAFTSTIGGRATGSTITATSSDGTMLSVTGNLLSGTFLNSGTPNITLTEAYVGLTPYQTILPAVVASAGGGTPTPTPTPTYLPTVSAAPASVHAVARLVAAYAGPAVSAVNASNATQDIGFDSSANLDTTALDSFAGATPAMAATLYDQVGGNHLTQATAASRPALAAVKRYAGLQPINLHRTADGVTARFLASTAGPALARDGYTVFLVMRPRTSLELNTYVSFDGAGRKDELRNNPVLSRHDGAGERNAPAPYFVRAQPVVIALQSKAASPVLSLSGPGPTVLSTAATAAAMVGMQVGNSQLSAANFANNDLLAVITYPAALSDAETLAVRTYLETRFAVPALATKQWVAEGDSITFGRGSDYGYGYVQQVANQLTSAPNLFNMGLGGTTVPSRQSANRPAAVYNSALARNVISLFLGINDIKGGATGTTVYNNLVAYCGTLRTQGYKIVVCTITGEKNNTSGETERTTLNGLIRANWASFADALADVANDPTVGTFAATSDAALFPDGLHPSNLACQSIAAVVAPQVNGLLA